MMNDFFLLMSKGTGMRLSQRAARIKPSATLTINAKAKALGQQGIRIINFGVGEPDFDTPEYIQKAAIDAIRKGYTRYTAVGGIDELKDAIVGMIRNEYGLTYGRENVLVSCGGKHALYNLFQALLDPGDEVIIPSPFWVSYPDMVELADGKPVFVKCPESGGFKLQADALEKAVTSRTRLLIWNSPSNPTGVHYRPAEMKPIAEVLLKYEHVAVVSDDIYCRILFGDHQWCNLPMVEKRLKDRTFIINGVSKTYCMTGWRIGYLVGDRDAVRAASDIQSQSTSNPTSIAQWASAAALRDHESKIRDMVREFESRSHYVLERLRQIPGVSCPEPAGAFYVFPNFGHYLGKRDGEKVIRSSEDLAEYLLEKAHLAVVPGGAFGEDRCLRLSYALSMKDLEEGFDRLGKALAELES